MNVPAAALELIKRYEGLRLEAYRCPAGKLTIGWGHTAAAGPPVPTIGMRITAEDADWIFHRDVTEVAALLRPLIDVALSDNQFGALVSFAFNFGVAAFEISTLHDLVNAGNFAAVPAELAKWCHVTVDGVKKVEAGLVARREAEGRLWGTAE